MKKADGVIRGRVGKWIAIERDKGTVVDSDVSYQKLTEKTKSKNVVYRKVPAAGHGYIFAN